jgi:hypothetical protein
MRRKIIIPIIMIIGLGSMVVLGSSPELVGSFLESIKSSPITKVFLPESQSDSKKSTLRNGEKVREAEVFPSENTNVPTNTKNDDAAITTVPDEIIYFILFKHLIGLKAQAERESVEGKTPLNYIELYKQQANLDDAQSQFLFQTAQDCMDAVKPIDDEAKNAITQARAQFPTGELNSPDDLPLPAKGLDKLQLRKNQMILSYKVVLENYLGTSKFTEFNTFARGKIAPQVTMNLTNLEEK